VRPWEIGRLTVEEFHQAIRNFEEADKAQAKGR
jgi:hypothetical protein